MALLKARCVRGGQPSGTCVQQTQGTLEVQVFMGGAQRGEEGGEMGGTITDLFRGLVGWNYKAKIIESEFGQVE